MDEFRRPVAPPPAGEDPDRGTGPETDDDRQTDDDQVEPDVVTHELGVRRVLDHLLGPTLAKRVALAEISLRGATPLAPVLQLRRLEGAEPGRPSADWDRSDADVHGVDGAASAQAEDDKSAAPDPPSAEPDPTSAGPDLPEAEKVDGGGPRGGVVIDLARYRAGRRGFGRRGRVIDLH